MLRSLALAASAIALASCATSTPGFAPGAPYDAATARSIADLNMQIRNTSVSHFHLNRERFLLSSWNAVPHLERAGREDAITYG